ncbi:hypothetical protein ACN47E_009542 [Coniothyrium glycines]
MLKNISLLLLATLAGVRVTRADFMVYTEPPIPTSAIPSFANQQDAASWTTSVALNARIAYARFESSLGAPYRSSQSSAASEISVFAQTASNYSIPPEVTNPTVTTTYFTMPDWYTALPSGARAFKEQQVSNQFSIVRSVIAARDTTSASSTAGAVPTARAWLSSEFGVMAGAAIAAFL